MKSAPHCLPSFVLRAARRLGVVALLALTVVPLAVAKIYVTPVVTSIARLQPGPVTTADTLTWRVTFNTGVLGVDSSDFTLTPVDGAATGTISSVAAGSSAAEYIVTATGVSGTGTLRLDVNASGTDIVDDTDDISLAGGFTAGQPYTHTRSAVALAWGKNGSGQLGNGLTTNNSVPLAVPASGALVGKTVVAVSAGSTYSLALCSDGTVAAWGGNVYGRLGNNSTTDSLVPVAVDTTNGRSALYGKTVVAVAAGRSHSLALCSDGTVVAWGRNASGQLGNESTTDSSVPVPVNTASGPSALYGKTVVAVAAGEGHSLALCSDGTVAAWGSGGSGQLGNSSSAGVWAPVAVNTSVTSALYKKTVVAVAAGAFHSVALCSDGTVAAWGFNNYGQLGNGLTGDHSTPVAVSTASGTSALYGKTVVAVAVGGYHSAALCSDGTVATWGFNSSGQLGDATTTNSKNPVAVNTDAGTSALHGKTVVALASGGFHLLARCSDGTVAAWGANADGGLGNNSTTDSLVPVAVNTDAGTSALSGRTISLFGLGYDAGHSLGLASPSTIVTAVATPSAGLYKAGAGLNFTLTLSGAATVTTVGGTPRLVLTVGSTTRYATYVSGSGTTSLVFTYTVQAGDTDADGIAVVSLDLNGGRIANTGDVAIAADLPSPDTSGIRIDAAAPAVASIARLQPGPVTTAASLTWRVTFSEAVTGVDVSDFALTPIDGAATGTIASVALGSSAAEYVVTATGVSGVGTLRLDVKSGGTGIADGAGYALAAGFTAGQPYTHTRNTVAVAWGGNGAGQLGNGLTTNNSVPLAVPATGALVGKTVVAVSAGAYHSLALCSDGTVAAWGAGTSGQLGNNSATGSLVPVAVDTTSGTSALYGKTVVAVAAGDSHSLALCSDGTVAAWGANFTGSLGNNSMTDSLVPVAVDTTSGTSALYGKTVVAVAAGSSHSVALCSDGTVAAWGFNNKGQLGDSSTSDRSVPVAVDTTSGTSALYGKTVVAVAAGGYHSAALCSDGTVATWGFNGSGQLGNNTTTDSKVPVAVNTASGTSALYGKTVTAVASGGFHLLALCSDGTVAAWGANGSGQLGNNTTTDSKVPVAVNTDAGTSALSGRSIYLLGVGYAGRHNLGLASPLATVTAVATPSAGLYKAGAMLSFTLTLSEAATVTTVGGTPRLALTVGSTTRYATYAAGSGTTTLVFSYTLQAGDNDADGIAIASTSIDLNGGTITAASGGSINAALPAYTLPKLVVDTTAPAAPTITAATATAVRGTAEPGSSVGVYNGAMLLGTVTADSSGNWSLAVTLADGSYSLTATATDAAGNTSTASVGLVATIAVPPVATSIARLQPGPVTTAASLTWRVTFSEAVTGVDVSDFTLTQVDGAATGTISSVAFGSSAAEYVVTATGVSGVGTLRLDLKAGGTGIADVAGNALAAGFTAGQPYTRTRNPTAVSWGDNGFGQLGTNSTANSSVPVDVLGTGVLAGKTVAALATGNRHSLALCSDGTVAAWGCNWGGRLGDGSTTDRLVPVAVNTGALAGQTVVAVAAGDSHSLALCSDGTVVAWGWNSDGQLGNGSTTESPVPVAVNTASGTSALAGKTVVAVAAGGLHSLALCSDGTVAAWGGNDEDQLGNDSTTDSVVPVAVNTVSGTSALAGKTVVAVAAGVYHSLALCSDGTVTAWGDNQLGQLGNSSTTDSRVPVAVSTVSGTSALAGKRVVAVAAGSSHSLALCSDGTVAAWGANGVGQLGINSTTKSPVPMAVNTAAGTSALAGKTVSTLAAGYSADHSLVLASPGLATVTAVAPPAAGSYKAGATLGFTLTTSAPATVDTTGGTPRLALTIGTATRHATYVSGSGTISLVFTYTVQAGDTDADGIAIASTSIDLNGGSIVDVGGAPITLLLPGYTLPTIKVDTTAPETTLDTTPANPSASASATFTFSSADASASFEASLDSAAYAPATSPATFTGLADGSHTFSVRAIDAAGNVDATPASYTWTVDSTAPTAPTIASASSTAIAGTAEAGSTVRVYAGATLLGTTTADGSGNWSLAVPLADGAYSLTATATDSANNTTSTSGVTTRTVDTTAPTVPTGLSGQANSSTAVALVWNASSDVVGVTGYRICRNGTAIGTSTTTSYSDTGLTAGTAYSYTVTAYDAAGHESAASAPATVTTQLSGAQRLAVASTAELEAALATAAANPAATYTITLAAGTYTPTTGLTISTAGLILEGSGTLSGSSLTSGALLTLSADSIVVSGLTFANGTVSILAGADHGAIDECTFLAAGIVGTGGTGWALTGNSFSDTTGAALTFTAAADLVLADNVVVDCAQAFVLSNLTSPKVRNNFIANNGASAALASIVLTDVSSAQIDHNTVYQAGTAANSIEYAGSVPVGFIRNNLANKPITATGSATATLATNCTTATANWFRAPADGDLHLVATRSEVVGAATALADLTVDIDGDTRPTGSAADIGADEFQPDTIAPTAPTGLSATALSSSQITVSWTGSTDSAPSGATATGVAGYRIYRNGVAIGTSTTASYADTGLSAGTTYTYTVTAYDGAANESAASGAVRATTTAGGATGGDTGGSGGGGAIGLLLPAALALLALGRRRIVRR